MDMIATTFDIAMSSRGAGLRFSNTSKLYGGLAQLASYQFDLLKVIDIVSCKVHGYIAQRLDATFGVNTEHVPFLGGERLQEFQIREPQRAVQCQRVVDVARGVPP